MRTAAAVPSPAAPTLARRRACTSPHTAAVSPSSAARSTAVGAVRGPEAHQRSLLPPLPSRAISPLSPAAASSRARAAARARRRAATLACMRARSTLGLCVRAARYQPRSATLRPTPSTTKVPRRTHSATETTSGARGAARALSTADRRSAGGSAAPEGDTPAAGKGAARAEAVKGPEKPRQRKAPRIACTLSAACKLC